LGAGGRGFESRRPDRDLAGQRAERDLKAEAKEEAGPEKVSRTVTQRSRIMAAK
jgi:hypothetical protein